MELTININTQQPKVDAFLNFIKSLDFIEITNIKSNEDRKHLQQKKFKKKLFTALDELKDAREGKIKLGNLEDLLNEIKIWLPSFVW